MNWQHIFDRLHSEMASGFVATSLTRLVLAAFLGGLIGLERELKHRAAGLRTNMFICFGAALFTVLSRALAAEPSDYTRIAAQIIPGIGFIGAGSILHMRGLTTGLTTAATLFVVASVGMAAGGGLYVTAIFATLVILIVLALLGKLERKFGMRSMLVTYEVTGTGAEAVLIEANRVLDEARITMQNVRVTGSAGHVRVLFNVDGSHDEQEQVNVLLHQSTVFATVGSLGAVEHE